MAGDGTQPTDQSSTRLSQDQLDWRAREAGRNPLAVSSLYNPDNTFNPLRGMMDPKLTANMPQMLQGLTAMLGPFISAFTGFLQNMGTPGTTPTPNAPGNTNPQVTQPLVMSQNYAPRGPTGSGFA